MFVLTWTVGGCAEEGCQGCLKPERQQPCGDVERVKDGDIGTEEIRFRPTEFFLAKTMSPQSPGSSYASPGMEKYLQGRLLGFSMWFHIKGRGNCWTARVIEPWNSLPNLVNSVETVNCFKNALDYPIYNWLHILADLQGGIFNQNSHSIMIINYLYIRKPRTVFMQFYLIA